MRPLPLHYFPCKLTVAYCYAYAETTIGSPISDTLGRQVTPLAGAHTPGRLSTYQRINTGVWSSCNTRIALTCQQCEKGFFLRLSPKTLISSRPITMTTAHVPRLMHMRVCVRVRFVCLRTRALELIVKYLLIETVTLSPYIAPLLLSHKQ